MSKEPNKTEQPANRVRLGVMVKPENLEAVKTLKLKTEAKSEGAVVDSAIEHYDKHIAESE